MADVSQVFDPLGMISPVVMIGKAIFQKIWLHKVDWDDLVPMDIFESWSKWRGDLVALNNFK